MAGQPKTRAKEREKTARALAKQFKRGPQTTEEFKAQLELEHKVIELRVRGMRFDDIERTLGCDRADWLFDRGMSRPRNRPFVREQAILLEAERLDALQEGIWDKAVGGDSRAIEVTLKLLERRARLLGLDFQDLLNGKLVEIEQAKVNLLATALVETLRGLGLSKEQESEATALFFQKIRALSGSSVTPQHEARDTVPGELA